MNAIEKASLVKLSIDEWLDRKISCDQLLIILEEFDNAIEEMNRFRKYFKSLSVTERKREINYLMESCKG
jgi:hypothetical protein